MVKPLQTSPGWHPPQETKSGQGKALACVGSVSWTLLVALAFLLFFTWIFNLKKGGGEAKEPEFEIYRKQCFLSVCHLSCLIYSSTFGATPLSPDAASAPENRGCRLLVPVPPGFWFQVGTHRSSWTLVLEELILSFPTLPFHPICQSLCSSGHQKLLAPTSSTGPHAGSCIMW